MTKIELERALEDRCCAKIEARGGLCLKLRPPTGRGFPDRLVMVPRLVPVTAAVKNSPMVSRPVTFYVEFKRPKLGVVAKQQTAWRRMLTLVGYGVYTVDNDDDFDSALERELSK